MKKLIIIALVVSIITGIAIFQFASSLQNRTDQKTAPVVVAQKTIPAGTMIVSEMVTVNQVPVEYVHELSISNADEVIGRITKESIEVNEQVLKTRLSDVNQENNNLSYSIDPNYRAVAILTDEETGVAGYLTKGDRVDVVAAIPSGSQFIVENVEILEIGSKTTNKSGEDYTSVTVSVPVNDVTKLSYSLSSDAFVYRLVLRSPVDKGIVGAQSFAP